MSTARERLAKQKSRPILVQLHRALSRLTSTLTVMNSGAHPDDEHSGMLATLRYGYGMRLVIACSTRGEGGQNSLGPERSGALGVLRTREMEEAARVLDADVAWLGHGPDDTAHDFGFSKNGTDTLARWGRDKIIERMVTAYRYYRPDIVIPTFLDVPGQHGHHRAMTEAAEVALNLAAAPEFVTPGLTPWTVAKYYLPARSGGGDTYDDELPPPPTTVEITVPGRDLPTGAAFDQIGQWSRAFHATQGMGRWKAEPTTRWPLHLKRGPSEPETDIRANLPASLAELADLLPEKSGVALRVAQDHINQALRSFPQRDGIVTALIAAAEAIEIALAHSDSASLVAHRHRLDRKRAEIDMALLLAQGVEPTIWVEPNRLAPGQNAALFIHTDPDSTPITATPIARTDVGIGAPRNDPQGLRFAVTAAPDTPLSEQFPHHFHSLGGNGELSVEIKADIKGRSARANFDLEEALSISPAHSVDLVPDAIILRTGQSAPKALRSDLRPMLADHSLVLEAPDGWQVATTSTGFAVSPPQSVAPGRYHLPLLVDLTPAYRTNEIAYPHIGRSYYRQPQALDILALELMLPKSSIAYVGGGSDRVPYWLRAMGLRVDELDDDALAADLSTYTTILIGTFGFGARPALNANSQRLHQWVANGGHLLTLYHRPSDGWNPDSTPPKRLVIGSPSLRWRVTNPDAEVTILQPDHPLLNGPNRISPEDWAGWDKERGLYFAAEWDPIYQPIIAMHDAGEAPLEGALLSASIGKGRHTHTALVLHHQLDKLVPGAFRLLANLVQPA
ncbi:PIG-L family deacetylase [Devosia rhodophyticola]|uniref:PIG-L family deacetylase n=1 Tax=Devosia rhodophyticola TaxID=3026423 RepID=A0ABY7YUB1_9HYPH|nr:PIG-L family deacetylase [Devosia rhodophyticola]WDR04539.1 PIG-L family deacetylase [Devosia rhodophyticola]